MFPLAERYGRQTLLPEIGLAGQERLRHARVLCVGAGGLGCAALPYLAGAGVGRITVVDDDVVERSNLQRQVLYGERDLGAPKATAAAARLRDLNPDIEVIGMVTRVGADNVDALLAEHDVVLDGSDNYPTKFLLGDATALAGKPLVYGSVTGMEGMVTVFDARVGPCLRCLFPQPPRGWVPNCADAGVLGPLVGMIGAVQAAEAIKLIVAGGAGMPADAPEDDGTALRSLVGRTWVFDARDMSTRQLATKRRPGCPTCAGTPEPLEVSGPTCAAPRLLGVSADEARALAAAVFVDVRERDEFISGHLPGALHLPLSRLASGDGATLPPAERYVLYCQHETRSIEAAKVLAAAGVPGLVYLKGGIAAWTGAVERGSVEFESSLVGV